MGRGISHSAQAKAKRPSDTREDKGNRSDGWLADCKSSGNADLSAGLPTAFVDQREMKTGSISWDGVRVAKLLMVFSAFSK